MTAINPPPGTYLPAGATTPVADPGGTFTGWNQQPQTTPAGTFANPYRMNELFLEAQQQVSNTPMIFSSAEAVAERFGSGSQLAQQARTFFGPNGLYNGIAQFIVARDPEGQRDHLGGANLGEDTLAQLQAISGTVSLVFDGFTYQGAVDLLQGNNGLPGVTQAGFAGVQQAGHLLQAALNANRQAAATTINDTIVPQEATFMGYVYHAQLYVTQVLSGTMEIGGRVSGPGISVGTNDQIIEDHGSTGGVEHMSFFATEGTIGSVTKPVEFKEDYGVLTIGGVNSGTVAPGLEITDKAGDLVPKTAIDVSLGNNQFVVSEAQTWSAAQATLKAPLLTVSTNGNGIPLNGPQGPIAYLSVTSNPAFGFNQLQADMGYLTDASGTAAEGLGLSSTTAAFLSTPSGQNGTIAQALNADQAYLATLGTGFGRIATNEQRLFTLFGLYVAKHPGIQFDQGPVTIAGSSAPEIDPAGTYSGPGASAPTIGTPPGTYISLAHDLLGSPIGTEEARGYATPAPSDAHIGWSVHP